MPPDAPAVQLAQDAFEQTMGRRPLLVRSGGTLPIVPALVDKGIPTIVTGFATPESSIHSPNERLLAEYMPLGIETAKELYRRLAALRASAASSSTSHACPKRRISSMIGSSASPFAVSSYSTRGGDSA